VYLSLVSQIADVKHDMTYLYFRILPLYGVLVLVYAAFGQYLGAGPLFDWESARVRDCNNNWWASLLFINNFVKPREMVSAR